MKLYSSLTSPFARKIRVLVRELGLLDSVEEVLVDPFAPPPEFLIANPLSKIPALCTASGQQLPDSKLISDYLQSHSTRKIAPLPRGNARWEFLRLSYIAEGMLEAAVSTVLEKRRPEGIIYTNWLDRQEAAIMRGLSALTANSDSLKPGTELPRMLEISVGVALGYLDFRMPYVDWRAENQPLEEWFRGFAQRSSMRETQPPAAR